MTDRQTRVREPRRVTAASNGRAALALIEHASKKHYGNRHNNKEGFYFSVYKYAPSSLGKPENREEFLNLLEKAAAKLGYKKDKRCKSGWRKL